MDEFLVKFNLQRFFCWLLNQNEMNNAITRKKFTNTLEPPYKRPPYSGSVDGVL